MESLDPRFAKPEALFFGIGAQKAGTTWLAKTLNTHPDVAVAPGKEMHYWTSLWRQSTSGGTFVEKLRKERQVTKQPFRKKLLDRNLGYFNGVPDTGHRIYADRLFARYKGQRLAGEVTPGYALLPTEYFQQIAALHPKTKFIFLMRDPIERIHSACRKVMRNKRSAEEDDTRSLRFSDDQIIETFERNVSDGSFMLNMTTYHRTMANLEAAVSRADIHYAFYENLFSAGEVERLCTFLEIERFTADFETRYNVGNPREDDTDPAFVEAVMPHVREVYAAVRERFGPEVPAAWRA